MVKYSVRGHHLAAMAVVLSVVAGTAVHAADFGPLPASAVLVAGTLGRTTPDAIGKDYVSLALPTLYMNSSNPKALMIGDNEKYRGFYYAYGQQSSSDSTAFNQRLCSKDGGKNCIPFAEGTTLKVSLQDWFIAKTDFVELGADRDIAVIGPDTAPITMVAYRSLTSTYDRDYQERIMGKLMQDYIGSGKVRYVWRDFPHNDLDVQAAKLLRCTTKGKFFDAAAALYKRQKDWMGDEKGYNPKGKPDALRAIVAEFAASPGDLDRCANDENLATSILASRVEGQRYFNVFGTPAVAVNGLMYFTITSDGTWKKIVDLHLAAKKG